MSSKTDLIESESYGGWQPESRLQVAPVFVWPLRPWRLFVYLFGFPGYLWPWNAFYAAMPLLSWLLLTDAARMHTLAGSWPWLILARNAALIVLVVSMWHLPLYVRRLQGTQYKYNARWLSTKSSRFLFHDQLFDNVFWTFASAIPIWSAYEIVTLWAQANGLIRAISWPAHPVYCALLVFVIPLLQEIHFYLVHRLIHWAPLYRAVHSLHHKNVNPGPWSGLAMHPVEHLLYFSGPLLLWIIPSHPYHLLFWLQYAALGPAQGHAGFGKVLFGDRMTLDTDSYFHYLHHKYVTVNYGIELIPLDKWFGTFHDGSDDAKAMMRRRPKREDADAPGT
jgi:sterol desaturase/sphingolipid hydroxylase (fatty acid hydroxylase superfamily)